MKTPRHGDIQRSEGVDVNILNLDEGNWTRGTGSCTPARTILCSRDDKIFSSRGESNLLISSI